MNEVEEVKARLDIVDVISQYVTLQKAGRSFKAPCPFHNERTPSFIVTPERQSWHCFGACGTGGDVITFVMKKEAIEFSEALKMLAERVGVKLQGRREFSQEQRRRERLLAANEAAGDWFGELLVNDKAGAQAREYLERRQIDSAAAKDFGLGYSPAAWDGLRNHLRGIGFEDEELLRVGLLLQGDSGLHDRFRGRLMFPIRDERGRTAGFGARSLENRDASGAKYINTAQSPVFDKSGLLYALHRATGGIRREGRAVIVEGYMDAIAAHQHGFDNVVASMGTALTERQVRLLRRTTGEIVLALDADAAGREAATRGHDVVRGALSESRSSLPVVTWRGLTGYQQTVDVELKVAVLPDGRDPDDVIRASPEDWRSLVNGAVPVLDFRLESLAAAHDLSTPAGRSRLAHDFLPILSVVTDPVVRAQYLQRLGRLTATAERELSTMLAIGTPRPNASKRMMPQPQVPQTKGDNREEFLLALLLQFPALREDSLGTPKELLRNSENRAILEAWKGIAAEPHGTSYIEGVKNALPMELWPHLERLTLRKMPDFDIKQARAALMDCVQRLLRRGLEAEKQVTSALFAEREAEVGASLLAEAASGATLESDKELLEVLDLQAQDMRTGLRLHGREEYDGSEAVQTGDHG
ncbi:MAG: DNA primase [Chloroflexi bacterium]|nr:MAG: DNA primase [Chloroflexota bacterium]